MGNFHNNYLSQGKVRGKIVGSHSIFTIKRLFHAWFFHKAVIPFVVSKSFCSIQRARYEIDENDI